MQFLEVAYEGASFVVVLDGGEQTERTADELRSQVGGRVEVRRSDRDQIEKYFTRNGIAAWLAIKGMKVDAEREGEVDAILSGGIDKGAFQHLASRYLKHEYHVEEDGGVIARLMPEQEIPEELKTLLLGLYGD
jgi:hypothetical protein